MSNDRLLSTFFQQQYGISSSSTIKSYQLDKRSAISFSSFNIVCRWCFYTTIIQKQEISLQFNNILVKQKILSECLKNCF